MIDLKQLMEERSASPPAQADLRYRQIRRRITKRNHRRVALIATMAAVVLAIAGGYAALPRQRVAPDPSASPSTARLSEGFPPYQFGRKMIHSEAAPISAGKLSVTWTPTTLEIHVAEWCSGMPENVYLRGSMTVNGNDADNFLCADHTVDHTAFAVEWERSGWIRIGEPITLVFTIETAATSNGGPETPAPMPPGGTMAVAIYAPVPFEEYQLPPRPDPLPDLADWTDCRLEQIVFSDPADPLRPVSFTTQWRDQIMFRWDTQTPGLLHFAVDGLTVATVGWWDYGNLNWSRTWDTTLDSDWAGIQGWKWPAQGSQVTVTFTPEHFTGAWEASITHLARMEDSKPCR